MIIQFGYTQVTNGFEKIHLEGVRGSLTHDWNMFKRAYKEEDWQQLLMTISIKRSREMEWKLDRQVWSERVEATWKKRQHTYMWMEKFFLRRENNG